MSGDTGFYQLSRIVGDFEVNYRYTKSVRYLLAKLARPEGDVYASVMVGEDGVARGAMGVDAGDYDRSGRPHLIVGNFSNQMLGLYHNEGTGLFVDEAPSSAVGRASLLTLSFGVQFLDYDLDGHLEPREFGFWGG